MTQTTPITLRVNGVERHLEAEPRLLLADALRGPVGLTGTHLGCEHGVCGACTVLVDGEPVRSCLTFAVQMQGKEIETVESLAVSDDELNPLQAAFQRHHALQCGFCTPGILMSLTGLFRDAGGHPDEDHVREYLQGHICRCTGYQQIVEAALETAGVPIPGEEVAHR